MESQFNKLRTRLISSKKKRKTFIRFVTKGIDPPKSIPSDYGITASNYPDATKWIKSLNDRELLAVLKDRAKSMRLGALAAPLKDSSTKVFGKLPIVMPEFLVEQTDKTRVVVDLSRKPSAEWEKEDWRQHLTPNSSFKVVWLLRFYGWTLHFSS